jgi:hypothetical protein
VPPKTYWKAEVKIGPASQLAALVVLLKKIVEVGNIGLGFAYEQLATVEIDAGLPCWCNDVGHGVFLAEE